MPSTADGKDVAVEDEKGNKGASQFVIQMHGILPSGHTAMVTIINIDLFFHIQLDERVTETRVLNVLSKYHTRKIEYKKLYKTYMRNKAPFIRLRFNTKREYQAAIEKAHDENFVTFTDDYDNIQNKIARETDMTFGSWNRISDFYVATSNWNCPYSNHSIICDVAGIKKYDNIKAPLLKKDLSVTMTTDIEVYAGNEHKDFVAVNNRLDLIKSISGSFHWVNDDKPFFTYAISAQPTSTCANLDKFDNLLIVQCRNEAEVLQAWGVIRGKLNPQYHLDFNGGDFDTPWIVERSKQLGILWEVYAAYANVYTRAEQRTDDQVYKFPYSNGRGRNIKVENGVTSFMKDLKVPGCVNIDVMLVFKNIHKQDDVVAHSLNGFLEINNLGGKVAEMSYELMDEIFQTGTREQMAEVLYYNIIDSIKCQELMVKRNMIVKYRAMAVVANVTINNAVYNADGMKCVNMAFYMAYLNDHLLTNFSKDPPPDGKFGGAYVPKPDVGPSKRPAGSVDFKSLYPSIMRAYNVSGDKIVTDPDEIAWLEAHGERLVRSEYEFLGQKFVCYIIQHDGDPTKMGILGQVASELFEKRDALKVLLNEVKDKLVQMEDVGDHLLKPEEFAEHKFTHGKLDAEQLAVKVLMNTMYGKAGDPGHMNSEHGDSKFASGDGEAENTFKRKHIGYNTSSQLYVMDVSSSITAFGQILIKYVHRRLEEEGCKSKYGDTDSVYFTMNDSYYVELDKQYDEHQIDKATYWKRLVIDSIGYMNSLCIKMNKEFIEMTKGPYIKLATEGVKWPVIFTGKKKYIGIEHLDPKRVKFDIDYSDYMLKGIEAKKRGNAEILKLLSKDIIVELMSINNPDDMPYIDAIGIVKKHIARIYNEKWDMEYFIKIARYKRNSANVAKPFVERMIREYEQETTLMQSDPAFKRMYYVPNNQAKFKYAVVKKPDDYDFNGRVIPRNQHWFMEYPEVITAKNYEIDLDKFVESNVLTPCARFIVHMPEFFKDTNGNLVEDDVAIKKAVKYLRAFTQHFTPQPFKNKYTYTAVRNTRKTLMGNGGISSCVNSQVESFIQNPTTNEIMEYAETKCRESRNASFGQQYLADVKKKCDIFKLYNHMNPTRSKAFSLFNARKTIYVKMENDCCKKIQAVVNIIHKETEAHLVKVNNYVMRLGNSLDELGELEAKKSRAALTDITIRQEFLDKVRPSYALLDEHVITLISIKACKDQLNQTVMALQSERNARNIILEPPLGFKPPLLKK
jgi:DNA polymerase elongation subunit (family B)